MTISQLARQAGIAPSAVRYYESTGVLPAPRRSPNGYRIYGAEDVARLRLLVTLRRLGLEPASAGRAAALALGTDAGGSGPGLRGLIENRREIIAGRRAELDRLESELLDLEATFGAAERTASTKRGGIMPEPTIRVLFVCTGNSARSQIAEALLRRQGGDAFDVSSAGTLPTEVNPFTVRALAELGIDWSTARSKSVVEFVDQRFDYVITVCDRARQTCPVFPGHHDSLHWGLEDPAEVDGTDEVQLAAFRQTRSDLLARIRPFVELALRARRERSRVATTG